MNKNDRMKSALLAVFPTTESIIQFTSDEDNYKALRSLITIAYEHDIIKKTDKISLFDFIRSNSMLEDGYVISKDLTFELFFDQKEKLLDLNLSLRALTDHINTLLTTFNLKLPKVTNSMLSRLKREPADTAHKQNVLRSLAFWIGYYRSHLIGRWNFESLLLLCKNSKQHLEHKAGARIGFALTGRGDAIDLEIIDWLKKNLKNYIESALGKFAYGSFGKVRSLDITTLQVDFPKEYPLNSPATYRQCLHGAISIAHQIAVRWALTPYCSQNRFLSIGIAAGDFATLDNYLLPLLNTRLPGDPVIRLTDYARQCVLINDIRVILCGQPEEITLFNGENLTIWWVVGVWSTFYFDFVPDLLKDPLLGTDPIATRSLFSHLWGHLPKGLDTLVENTPSAVVTFLRFPHNCLLGLEIAKTLYYRRRFWEAIHILKVLLSLNTTHIHARTLLMILYRSLAIIAPNRLIANELFNQAHKEADFIVRNCDFQSEDFYCEYAVIFLTRALCRLQNLRRQTVNHSEGGEITQIKELIFEEFDRADDLFESAMMVSPSGIRAHYLRNSVRIIRKILKEDDSLFTDSNRPIDSFPDVIRGEIINYQWQYGMLREDIPQSYPYESQEKIFNTYIQSHDDAIALQAYRPTTYYCTAVSWWDLFPVRTVGVAKRVIHLLEDAAEIAKEMHKKGVGIYSFTRIYGEVIPSQEFIDHMARCIKMIKAYCGDNLKQGNNRKQIEPKGEDRFHLLMTVNF